MIRKIHLLLITVLSSILCMAQKDTITPDSVSIQQILTYYQEADRKDSLLAYQHGKVEIGKGLASVDLGEDFKYLDPNEANKILTDAWGNPPQTTLGMIFPDSVNPYLYSGWGVVLYYEEDGHIDDEDAADIDYDDMLEELQEDAKTESEDRRKEGYTGFEVIGWAEDPFYDAQTKKLHWAKALKFDDSEDTTLNYEIRILGRKGYLQLNAIAGIDQIQTVKPSMQHLLSRVEFNDGNTYFDFDPSVDRMAAYGVGALVAGKLAAKVGLIKGIALFFGKFWKVILVAIAGIGGFFRKLFTGKEKRTL